MALYTGNIKFTATDTEPTSDKGRIYYDDSQSQLKHYNGDDWLKVNTSINYDRPGDGQYYADSYTKLLIHSDTSNGSTTFNDSSAGSHTITATNANHSTTEAKIGGSSMYFDGSGDYLTTAQSTDWQFGTGNYTIDFWLNWEAVVSNEVPICYGAGDGVEGWKILFDGTNATWYCGSGVGTLSVAHGLTAGAWYHWAIVRESMVVTQYKNGISLGSTTHAGTMGATSSLGLTIGAVGQTSSQEWDGFLDEFRVSKGIARWTSNFTVY